VTVARAEYLFALAYHCHVSPPGVDAMTIADFGLFCVGIDELTQEGS
jgi:hypothetical protein